MRVLFYVFVVVVAFYEDTLSQDTDIFYSCPSGIPLLSTDGNPVACSRSGCGAWSADHFCSSGVCCPLCSNGKRPYSFCDQAICADFVCAGYPSAVCKADKCVSCEIVVFDSVTLEGIRCPENYCVLEDGEIAFDGEQWMDGCLSCQCEVGVLTCTDERCPVDECSTGTHTCDVNANCTDTPSTFECRCNQGFTGDGHQCQDIDECLSVQCGDNSHCTNLPGWYQCECNNGFSWDGQTCQDVDECESGIHACDVNALCINIPGSFMCQCIDGFTGTGLICEDIDECLGSNDCGTDALCINLPGSYSCSCVQGFYGDGITCQDIDECELDVHDCDLNALCINRPGSFTCQCKAGYIVDGFTCVDINECVTGEHNCDANAYCTNTMGSFNCTCANEYIGDGINCRAMATIDRCPYDFPLLVSSDDRIMSCSRTRRCTVKNPMTYCYRGPSGSGCCPVCPDTGKTPGTCESDVCDGFECNGYPYAVCKANPCADCQPTAYDPLTLKEVHCSSVDECSTGTHTCDVNANCTDTPSSFECRCNQGFTGDGHQCQDIDECLSVQCGDNFHCTNLPGSYQCECNNGFSWDGQTCQDVDECESGIHACDVNALCINIPGSFMCQCIDGFTGTGLVCEDIDECLSVHCGDNSHCTNSPGSYQCECNNGFSWNGQTCQDVDECESGIHACDVNAMCTNIPGSFMCQCIDGFTGTGLICEDIDECLGSNDCDTDALCINLPGSYSCSCVQGFYGDGITCQDIDECELDVHDCDLNALCINRPGSFTCQCKAGYIVDGFTCVDINECVTGEHNCDANAYCTNTMGLFNCTCANEYIGDGINCRAMATIDRCPYDFPLLMSSDERIISCSRTRKCTMKNPLTYCYRGPSGSGCCPVCPDTGKRPGTCESDVCDGFECNGYPNAVCKANPCADCQPTAYDPLTLKEVHCSLNCNSTNGIEYRHGDKWIDSCLICECNDGNAVCSDHLCESSGGILCPDSDPLHYDGIVFNCSSHDCPAGHYCRHIAPSQGVCCPAVNTTVECIYDWTEWFDITTPVDSLGDFETLFMLCKSGINPMCDNTTVIDVRTVEGNRPAQTTGEVFYSNDAINGFICRNQDQFDGQCENYEVRFCFVGSETVIKPVYCQTNSTAYVEGEEWLTGCTLCRCTNGSINCTDQYCGDLYNMCDRGTPLIADHVTNSLVFCKLEIIHDCPATHLCQAVNISQIQTGICCPISTYDQNCVNGTWTDWYDLDKSYNESVIPGDLEVLQYLISSSGHVCKNPLSIDVQTDEGIPAYNTGQTFYSFDVVTGFVCRNADQNGEPCLNYRVRLCCPEPSFCDEDMLTPWFDLDNPCGMDTHDIGDVELLSVIRDEYPLESCDFPTAIQVHTVDGVPAEQTGQVFRYMDVKHGFICRDKDQEGFDDCLDYKIRFCCNYAPVSEYNVSKIIKKGQCPLVIRTTFKQIRDTDGEFAYFGCQDDRDCAETQKCCPSGEFGTLCMDAISPCRHDGIDYPPGSYRQHSCNFCGCEDGVWECTQEQCDGY
ncbi:uncharacterized protein LOC100376785 [Saccoglossus kowalevskii]|uniref:Fibrillin-2-like n=1 Tax=Saccoglossus kowalevskii TaxID=10224 RepID=A0ABM0MKB9_SACKO|nr:PREDICTED: fibrillin-2-like [Saccoglossus kowalevskii]